MKKCQYCHGEILPGERICPGCGANEFYDAPDPKPDPPPTPAQKPPASSTPAPASAAPAAPPSPKTPPVPAASRPTKPKPEPARKPAMEAKPKPAEKPKPMPENQYRQKPQRKQVEYKPRESGRQANSNSGCSCGCGCLIVIFVFIMIMAFGFSTANTRNKDEIALYENTMQISESAAEQFVETMKLTGTHRTSSLQLLQENEAGEQWYEANTTRGRVVIRLDADRSLNRIWSEKIDRALYEDGEVKLKLIATQSYRDQSTEIVKGLFPKNTYLSFAKTNDWRQWTDFDKTYAQAEVKHNKVSYLFTVTFDKDDNIVSFIFDGVERVAEI